MRHGPAVCTVTVCWPSGIPPFHTFRFPLPSSHMTQKKASDTGCYYLKLLKASSPDLQSTGNSKVGKGVIHLFFWDLLLPRHPGYECSTFCWIITAESMGMWFKVNRVFNRVYRYTRLQSCPVFSACLEKTTGLKLLPISFLVGSN